MNASPNPAPQAPGGPPLRRRDRLLARAVAGPIGRGVSFALELTSAIARGLRGERQDPEERRYE